jgi:hypothetical protein
MDRTSPPPTHVRLVHLPKMICGGEVSVKGPIPRSPSEGRLSDLTLMGKHLTTYTYKEYIKLQQSIFSTPKLNTTALSFSFVYLFACTQDGFCRCLLVQSF